MQYALLAYAPPEDTGRATRPIPGSLAALLTAARSTSRRPNPNSASLKIGWPRQHPAFRPARPRQHMIEGPSGWPDPGSAKAMRTGSYLPAQRGNEFCVLAGRRP